MSLPVFNFDDFSYEDCQTFIESLCVRESEKQKLVYLSSPLYKGEGNWHSSFQSDHRIKYINPKRWFTSNSEKLVFMDKLAIRACDYVVAYIPKLSAGASMEILYAKQKMKPVYAIIREDLVSPWHLAHCKDIKTFSCGFFSNSLCKAKPLFKEVQDMLIKEIENKYIMKD